MIRMKTLFAILLITFPTLSLAHQGATSLLFHHLTSAHHAFGGLLVTALVVLFLVAKSKSSRLNAQQDTKRKH